MHSQIPGQVLCFDRTCFLQRRWATSAVQNSWLKMSQGPTWQMGVLELFSLWWFSIESAWCTVNCVRAQQRGFQLQSNKSTFCTPWSMNEVLKIQKRTLRLFETYRMFLYFYLNLANVVHHRSSELSGKDQGRNTASAWITDSTAISNNTAGI